MKINLITVAANVGIDAKGKTLSQVEKEYRKIMKGVKCVDQFDMYFEEFIKNSKKGFTK